MGNIFKSIGKGILYFFAFPGLLIAISVYALVGIFVFIFQFFKLIFLFFTGRNLFSDLPEDIELRAKTEPTPTEDVEEKEDNQISLYPSDSIVYSNDYSSPMVKEEESKEEEQEPAQEVVPLDVLDDDKYNDEEGGEN